MVLNTNITSVRWNVPDTYVTPLSKCQVSDMGIWFILMSPCNIGLLLIWNFLDHSMYLYWAVIRLLQIMIFFLYVGLHLCAQPLTSLSLSLREWGEKGADLVHSLVKGHTLVLVLTINYVWEGYTGYWLDLCHNTLKLSAVIIDPILVLGSISI